MFVAAVTGTWVAVAHIQWIAWTEGDPVGIAHTADGSFTFDQATISVLLDAER